MFYGGEDDEHDFLPTSGGGCVIYLIRNNDFFLYFEWRHMTSRHAPFVTSSVTPQSVFDCNF